MFAIGALWEGTRPFVRQPRLMWLSGITLSLAIGLRLEVGGDWYVYLRMFNYLKAVDLETALSTGGADPAYGFVNWTVGQLGLRVWTVNLVCAIIFTTGLLSLCRQQPLPRLAVLTAIPYLVIVVAMGYTRQSAAIGLLMLAVAQLSRGRTAPMLLSLALAAAFHKTAVVMIPVIALASARQRLTTFLALALLAGTAFYMFLADATDSLLSTYLERRRFESSGATVRIVMNLVPALLLLGFRNRFGFDRNQLRLWVIFALAAIAALAAFLLLQASTMVDRLALYLIPIQVVILSRLPIAFGSLQRNNQFILALVVAYSLAVELVYLNFAQYSSAWLPYRNYLWAPSGYMEYVRPE